MSDQAAWYLINVYQGHEQKVRDTIEKRMESRGIKDQVVKIKIPVQFEKGNKEQNKFNLEDRVYPAKSPGYVMINMVLTEETWSVITNTPGVTGFVGVGSQPSPFNSEVKIEQVLRRLEGL